MTPRAISEINKLDIVTFLEGLNIYPHKKFGYKYWYHSPFSEYKIDTPTFRVDRLINQWWDFHLKVGSTLFDFGVRYFHCTIRELLEKLTVPYPLVSQTASATLNTGQENINIGQTSTIQSDHLLRYLWERRIPLEVAHRYCVEAQYSRGQASYYAIAFRCNAGGYQLRSKSHQISTGPMSQTYISNKRRDIAIFADFLDLLTYITITNATLFQLPDLLVLNSPLYFESSLPALIPYANKHFFLPNHPITDQQLRLAQNTTAACIDHRPLYKRHATLNDWVCNIGKINYP